jgi:hypothetical protein
MGLFMVLGPVGFILLALAMVYIGLVARQRECGRAEAAYRDQLQLRANAIDILLQTISAGTATTARAAVETASEQAVQAASPDRFSFEEGQLASAIEHLVELASADPALHSDVGYMSARRELLIADARLTTARRSRRRAYAEYECACDAFPGVLFASMLGFKPISYDQPSLASHLPQ